MTTHLGRLLLALSFVALTGCGSADDRVESIPGGAPPVSTNAGSCTAGQVQECRITVAVRDGYTDCITGTQTCVGSTWGECTPKAASDAGPKADAASSD